VVVDVTGVRDRVAEVVAARVAVDRDEVGLGARGDGNRGEGDGGSADRVEEVGAHECGRGLGKRFRPLLHPRTDSDVARISPPRALAGRLVGPRAHPLFFSAQIPAAYERRAARASHPTAYASSGPAGPP